MGFPISATRAWEDTLFQVGDSPVTINLQAAQGAGGVGGRADGYIRCDGPGSIAVAFDHNGQGFGDDHTLRKGDIVNFEGIARIRITHLGVDSAYRVAAAASREVR